MAACSGGDRGGQAPPQEAAWDIEEFFISWCAQRLEPDAFWRQSPRSFVAVMKGCARAANREYELMIEQSWRVANFTGAGSKLKDLRHYLPRPAGENAAAVEPEIVVDALLTMQAAGVPVTVRKLS